MTLLSQTTTTPCPVKIDEEGVPYLSIPNHPELRLTPYLETDDDDLIKLFNDPEIGKWSWRRPYPYTVEHMDFVTSALPQRQALVKLITETLPNPVPLTKFDSRYFPFGVLRHVPSGRLIGDMYVGPTSSFSHSTVEVEEGGTQFEDGEVWEMAYNVSSQWQGKGVGSAMIKTTLEYLKWQGVKKVNATAEVINAPSGGVLRKNGFKQVKIIQLVWPEEKGGMTKDCYSFEQLL
ncbi:hypothetical protein CI109_107121 [Kwoniella shandongensis]|uniref:Uncharacterized protein n=1 Tax=Kwoniella shandongensis TaxID=1734106 RepID=A0A5M6C251_9TREE|nr:uncharacterized protein CI109_002404 [Kwoniella shandongensis]KAA5529063.1 hypothetical protein CI109_002404 [Kwoniella shandongensis]